MHNKHKKDQNMFLVFFNNLDFQIIKIDTVYKIVLPETGFAMSLEITNIHIQPDGFGQVKSLADFGNSMKNLGRTGFITVIAYDHIIDQTVMLKSFAPYTKHIITSMVIELTEQIPVNTY